MYVINHAKIYFSETLTIKPLITLLMVNKLRCLVFIVRYILKVKKVDKIHVK